MHFYKVQNYKNLLVKSYNRGGGWGGPYVPSLFFYLFTYNNALNTWEYLIVIK